MGEDDGASSAGPGPGIGDADSDADSDGLGDPSGLSDGQGIGSVNGHDSMSDNDGPAGFGQAASPQGTASMAGFAAAMGKGIAGIATGTPMGIISGIAGIASAISGVNSQGGFAGFSGTPSPGNSSSADDVNSGVGGDHTLSGFYGASANFDYKIPTKPTSYSPPLNYASENPRIISDSSGSDGGGKDITPIYIQNSSLADAPRAAKNNNFLLLAIVGIFGVYAS